MSHLMTHHETSALMDFQSRIRLGRKQLSEAQARAIFEGLPFSLKYGVQPPLEPTKWWPKKGKPETAEFQQILKTLGFPMPSEIMRGHWYAEYHRGMVGLDTAETFIWRCWSVMLGYKLFTCSHNGRVLVCLPVSDEPVLLDLSPSA